MNETTPVVALPEGTTCIIADGPQAEAGPPDFDEYPVWYVFYCDDDGEPMHDGWKFYAYETAINTAELLAERHNIECVLDASPA